MKADDQYMDDIFRKASEEQHFPYKSDFWNDAQAQLNDDSLDTAFKAAAENPVIMPDLHLTEALDDAFLDDAFRSAAENATIDYPANAWQTFLNEAPVIEQDIAFTAAANAVTADYHPAFWTDADQALQNEGLHYEYRSAYWNDARNLLDRADRKIFFFRWSAVAALLLLLSFGGVYQSFNNEPVISTLSSNNYTQKNSPVQISENHIDANADELTINAIENSTTAENPDNNLTEFYLNEYTFQSGSEDLTISQTPDVESPVNGAHLNTDNDLSQTDQISDDQTSLLLNSPEINHIEERINISQTTDLTNSVYQSNEKDLVSSLSPLPGNDINILNPVLVSEYMGPQIEIKRSRLSPLHTLSFIGNAGIGNKYGESDFTPSFRTSFGFEYKRTGSGRLRNFELGGSINMNHVHQNDFGTERRVNIFNTHGGVDKFWYKLQLKDMVYANVTGLVSYRLNKRNSLRTSVGLDYLVFVQSNMSYKVNADEGITTVNNNWGIKEGLTNMDIKLGLGYEFTLTSRFAVQLNSSFGFFDRSDDSFISKNFFDHEMNATVGLKYTFLRKL